MIFSILLAIVAALSSFVTVNGGIVQRQGTFTFVTPQPTSPTAVTSYTATGTSTTSSSAVSSSTVTYPSSVTTSKTIPVTTGTTSVIPPVTKTSSSPSPTGTSGAANCNGVQQWLAAFAYVAGDQVIYNGQLYTAKQWTYNNAPPAHPDQWTAGGTCAQPVNNQANCGGVPAWQSTVAYTSGNKVTYNDHLWSAVQWTEANPPGDTSGTWKDLGACA